MALWLRHVTPKGVVTCEAVRSAILETAGLVVTDTYVG